MAGSTGPSIRGVCRIINQNSCGSGSICGHYQGGSLVLTNAHVAGTQVGRKVQVDIESKGIRKEATVIRAAYSNQVSADWALLLIDGYQDIEPTYLSKKSPAPGDSLYTKGFPRCNPHAGTDITQHKTLNNGVILWLPDAIGGQSGSGVWDDATNLQMALLTWSWGDGNRSYGAGQLTSEIYRQNRAAQLVGFPKMAGLTELPGEWADTDRTGADDPVVTEGFFSAPMERGIQDYPIWAEDIVDPPPVDPTDPTEPCDPETRKQLAEYFRLQGELAERFRKQFEGASVPIIVDPSKPNTGETFGL